MRSGSHPAYVKPGSGLTPIGRKARKQRVQIESLSSSTGAPARTATNIKGGRKEISRLSAVRDALSRVQAAYSSRPSSKGLDIPSDIARLDVKIGHKYDVAPSLLASQQRQESHFDRNARSSAGAFGVSQFIPSTAASYGVKPGNVKSQIKGQAKYLTDLGVQKDPQSALTRYSGGYSAGSYNNPVLAGAKDFKKLDKPGHPPSRHDVKTLARAGVQAHAAKPTPQIKPEQAHRFQKIQKRANSVAGTPYVWGGGHGGGDPKSGLDCSGAVSYALGLKTPLTSGQMGSVLKPGPGAVTVYYNSGHTFMKIGNKFWGTSVGDSGSGGLGKHPDPSGSYLSQYSVGHVPGLGRDAAAALGVKLSKGGSASGGSTSASFSGGTVQGAPGFSNSPIKAISPQRQRQKRLNRVTAAYGSSSTASSGASVLAGKYDHPAV